MARAWQIPISVQDRGIRRYACLFHQSPRTDILVETRCGKQVNPGFAIITKKMKHCPKCSFPGAYRG